MTLRDDLSWMDAAACAPLADRLGVEAVDRMFFPEKQDAKNAVAAKNLCRACPVRAACREYAINGDGPWRDHGIWGGLNHRSRRAIRVDRATHGLAS